MFHCQIRSWFVQEWASHSSCESDGKHEFGDKSFPICFAPKAMSVWLPTKWDGSFSGQITIGASKPSCFIIFHHFSPFFTVQKKHVKSLLVFQKKTMFQTWTCHLIYKPQNWAQIPWKVEKKRINTWFNMVQKSLFVERTMPWLKKTYFVGFMVHPSPPPGTLHAGSMNCTDEGSTAEKRVPQAATGDARLLRRQDAFLCVIEIWLGRIYVKKIWRWHMYILVQCYMQSILYWYGCKYHRCIHRDDIYIHTYETVYVSMCIYTYVYIYICINCVRVSIHILDIL